MHATAHKEEGSRGRSNPAQLSQFWRSARAEVGGEALSIGGASACCRHSPRSERAARDAGMHRGESEKSPDTLGQESLNAETWKFCPLSASPCRLSAPPPPSPPPAPRMDLEWLSLAS